MVQINGQKLELNYPCAWSYKVIGPDEDKLRQAVAQVIQDAPHRIQFSKRSSGGKYISLGLEVTVHSEEHRLLIFNALKAAKAVKYVL